MDDLLRISFCTEMKSLAHLLDGPSLHDYAFLPAIRPAENFDRAERHVTAASEEAAQFVVRRSVSRWSRHTNLQRVTVDAGRLCTRCPRLDMHRNHNSSRHGPNHLSFGRHVVLSHR